MVFAYTHRLAERLVVIGLALYVPLTGAACKNSSLVQRCTTDEQCQNSQACDLGICHTVCQQSDQCASDQTCVWVRDFGFCRKSCRDSSECGDQETCSGGSCAPLPPDEWIDAGDGPHPGGDDAGTAADSGDTSDHAADASDGDGYTPPVCSKSKAFLHGNVWPFWYNYRVRCDYEHKMSWLCQKQGKDCSSQNQAYQQCNPCDEQDGICIPRTGPGEPGGCCDAGCDQGSCCEYTGPAFPDDEPTCFFGYYRSCRTDCNTRKYLYDDMIGHFYGKSWTFLGAWSIHFYDSSNNEITNQIVAGTQGQDANPQINDADSLGFFACYQLPTGNPITIKVSLHDWDNQPATKPQDFVESTITPQPGKHYVWGVDGLQEWKSWDQQPCQGPPQDIASRLGGISCSSL